MRIVPAVAIRIGDAELVSVQVGAGRQLQDVPVALGSIGLVTQADLVARHAHVHFPFYLTLLGGSIPFGEGHFRDDMRHITGRIFTRTTRIPPRCMH